MEAKQATIKEDPDYTDSWGNKLAREAGHIRLSTVEGVNLGWASKYLADFNLP